MKTSKLILVVEDNEAVRKAMKALLEGAGYRVVCAANGRDALDYLGQGELPCLILLDLSMPVMDGWQFCSMRRVDPLLVRIPVVLLSSEKDLGQITSTLETDGYLAKPIKLDELRSTIHQLVPDDDGESAAMRKHSRDAAYTATPPNGSSVVSQTPTLSRVNFLPLGSWMGLGE